MTNQQKLIQLLQPKEYKSKIKLYCLDCNLTLQKFENVKSIPYLSRIEIKDKKL